MLARSWPAALFALFILVCAYGAAHRSIWYDEAITLQTLAADQFVATGRDIVTLGEIARYFDGSTSLAELVRRYAETDVHPPLYFILLHLSGAVLGNGLFAARLVSLALAGTAVLVYWTALNRLGRSDRFVHAAVFALSFGVYSSAQDARGYALAILLVVLAWLLSIRADERQGRQGRLPFEIAIGIVCAALLYTHYFTIFVVIPILAWRIIQTLRSRTLAGLAAPVLCCVLFAPWLPVMAMQMGSRPDQMNGFMGLFAWVRAASNMVPAQVLSMSDPAAPEILQARLRDLVVLLILAGVAAAALTFRGTDAASRLARFAIWVSSLGLTAFLAATMLLDRWFVTFRYFVFFVPFFAFLAASGALWVGRLVDRATGGRGRIVAFLPATALIATQAASMNFGAEAIGTRGGNYYLTMRDQIEQAGTENSLVIIDPGSGRGTILGAAFSLPPQTRGVILPRDPRNFADDLPRLDQLLEGRNTVLLIYSIDRVAPAGGMRALFAPITARLTEREYRQVAAPPEPFGDGYYSKWVKSDET